LLDQSPLYSTKRKKKDDEEEDAFHFIGFVPVNGKLYELDGLKRGPIVIGDCTMANWLDKATPAILERIERYSTKEIRFNLLALCRNRKDVLTEELTAEMKKKTANSDTMDIESTEEQQARIKLDEKIEELKQQIAAEDSKFKAWKAENIRRRHNYVPLIYNLMKVLAEKGKLTDLVDKAAKVTQEKIKKKTRS